MSVRIMFTFYCCHCWWRCSWFPLRFLLFTNQQQIGWSVRRAAKASCLLVQYARGVWQTQSQCKSFAPGLALLPCPSRLRRYWHLCVTIRNCKSTLNSTAALESQINSPQRKLRYEPNKLQCVNPICLLNQLFNNVRAWLGRNKRLQLLSFNYSIIST